MAKYGVVLLLPLFAALAVAKCPHSSARWDFAGKTRWTSFSDNPTAMSTLRRAAALQQPPAHSAPRTLSSNQPDPLSSLNRQLQAAYGVNKANLSTWLVEHNDTSIIMVSGSHMYLYQNTLDTPVASATTIPNLYTQLKLAAHMTLGTYVILRPSLNAFKNGVTTTPLLEITRQQLTQYNATLAITRATLADPNRQFTAAQLTRAYAIFDHTYALIQGILRSGMVEQSAVANWAHSMGPLDSENINDAADACLDNLNSIIKTWRSTYFYQDTPTQGKKPWAKLFVVVRGSHMARHQELFMQYFARLLDTPIQSGRRLIYAEGLATVDDAFALLATHFMDHRVGIAFFDSEDRMHTDVLAPETTRWIDRNMGPAPSQSSPSSSSKGVSAGDAALIGVGCAVIGAFIGIFVVAKMSRRIYGHDDDVTAARRSSDGTYTSLNH